MKSLLSIVFGAAMLMSGVAHAADMPVKAPAAAPSFNTTYPFNGSGLYYGLGSIASETSPTVNGQVQNGLQAFGQSFGGVVGYRWGGTNAAIAAEGSAYYDTGNSSACVTAGCVVAARFESIERVKFIMPSNQINNLFPALGLPSLPAMPALTNLTALGTNYYVFAGADISDVSASIGAQAGRAWQTAPGFGGGIEVQLSNGSALDIWAGYFNPAQGFSIGQPTGYATQGRSLKAGLNWIF